MLYAVNYAGFQDNGRESLGVICVVLNIASIGAPLFQIGEVIRTKNSESLPLPLCLACFRCQFTMVAIWSTCERLRHTGGSRHAAMRAFVKNFMLSK
ncbi:hypothetical protein OSTOST_09702 [Ostertagia ostertagi]